MGPPRLMDAYFTTYRWMLDKRSWQHYDPRVRTVSWNKLVQLFFAHGSSSPFFGDWSFFQGLRATWPPPGGAAYGEWKARRASAPGIRQALALPGALGARLGISRTDILRQRRTLTAGLFTSLRGSRERVCVCVWGTQTTTGP